MTTYYFLGDVLLATSPQPPCWHAPDRPLLYSSAFICPACGNLWARIVVEGSLEWVPYKIGCRKHRYMNDIGGTFIHHFRKGCPPDLPDAIIKYEFELRLANLEREMENGQES